MIRFKRLLESYIIYVYCILSALALCSCGKEYDSFLQKANEIITVDPDSALTILKTRPIRSFSKERDRAYYALLVTRAKHNMGMYYGDSLMRVAEKYYEKNGSDREKFQILYNVGNSYSTQDSFPMAAEYYSKAEIYAKNLGDDHLVAAINNALGYCYAFQQDFEDALERFTIAVDLLKGSGESAQYLIPKYQQINMLMQLGRNEEALSAIYEAMPVAKQVGDTASVLKLSSSESMLLYEVDSTRSQDALDRLKQIYDKYCGGNVPISHYNILGVAYYRCGKDDEAAYWLNKSIQSHPPLKIRLGVYYTLSRLYERNGKYAQALANERKFSALEDSLFIETKSSLIQAAEMKYKNEYLQDSYDILAIRHQNQRLLFLVVIMIFILLAGLGYIIFRKRLKDQVRRQEEAMKYVDSVREGYSEISEKYESLKKELGQKAGMSGEMSRLLGKRMDGLKDLIEMASLYEGRPNQFYEKFKEYVKVSPVTNIKWEEDIISITDLFTHNLISDLHNEHPDLSRHEMCYCSLICLGFSQQSIRMLYDHTNMNSIYSLRTRIRSKLGINSSGKSLDNYFKELMESRGIVRSGQ